MDFAIIVAACICSLGPIAGAVSIMAVFYLLDRLGF
jgi:hypothetical protein